MRSIAAASLLLAFFASHPLVGQVDLLLVPPPDAEPPARRPEFTLYLNNPTEYDALLVFEQTIEAEYADAHAHVRVEMLLVEAGQRRVTVPKMTRRTVKLRPAADLLGWGEFVSLRLRAPLTNAVMFRPFPADAPQPAIVPGSAPPVAAFPAPPLEVIRPGLSRRHIDLTSDIETMRRHISGYDPIYFAVGWRERFNARFQFSFKYRPVDPGPDAWEGYPWRTILGKLHFAYTQTSIWDLESFSKPFYDSSYKPTVFVLHHFRPRRGSDWVFSLQGGAQHESNGKGGGSVPSSSRPGLVSATSSIRHSSDSRSLNSLYLIPRARWEDAEGHFFDASLRTSAYFQYDENPDIAQYRGHAELTLRGGYVRGLQFSTLVRGRVDGHGSIELNFTWPASESPLLRAFPLVGDLGGYAQIQYFNGYGESLLDYDVRRKDQLRFGLMIVR